MNPIPISIITGFLGAGKTTLLNNILTSMPKTRFGLIVNEFGSVGIDGQLIQRQDEEMIELTAGCMCCSIRGDIIKSITQLVDSEAVDYILIETSGVALPRPIIQTLMLMSENKLDNRARLDSVLCAIDPTTFQIRGDTFPTAIEQLRYSSIAVFTKTDIATRQDIKRAHTFIQTVNPDLKHVMIEKNKPIPIDVLLQTQSFNEEVFSQKDRQDSTKLKHPESFQTVTFRTDKAIDIKKFDTWNKKYFPKNAFRAKGIVRISTDEGVIPFIYQRVGPSTDLYPVVDGSTIDTSYSRIVAIGNGLSKKQYRDDLEKITVS